MPTDDDRFNRRPLRLDKLFTKLPPFYFVTFNASKRAPMLARPEIHTVFCAFCHKAHEKYDVAVGRYVIMPNHIHLFVGFPPTGITLSQWIQALKTVIGKELLRVGLQKPHWQEGFFDHLLRSSESYAEKWDYVRMNPVRAGLCESPKDWPYQGEIVRVEY
ncbi:MAG TPA: transposase [Chthoniobacterales bacterium]